MDQPPPSYTNTLFESTLDDTIIFTSIPEHMTTEWDDFAGVLEEDEEDKGNPLEQTQSQYNT